MKLLNGFFMAWGCFTIIPCPNKKWDENSRDHMLVALQLIGLFIGAIWLLVYYGLSRLSAPFFASAVIVAILPQAISGFIHVDGYMDCCDAIFSRRDLATKQRILKDSHIGAFAVIGLALEMLFGFSATCDILSAVQTSIPPASIYALLFIPMISRYMSALAIWKYRPLGTSQYAHRADKVDEKNRKNRKNAKLKFRIISAIVICIIILAFHLIVRPESECIYGVLLVEMIVHYIACLYARKQLGGMSGDVSGFAITVSELTALLTLAFVIA